MSEHSNEQVAADEMALTAYALGELNEAERAAVESRLAGDPAAQRAVEEIRRSAQAVTAALEVEKRAFTGAERPLRLPSADAGRRRWARRVIGVAACLAVAGAAITVAVRSSARMEEARRVSVASNLRQSGQTAQLYSTPWKESGVQKNLAYSLAATTAPQEIAGGYKYTSTEGADFALMDHPTPGAASNAPAPVAATDMSAMSTDAAKSTPGLSRADVKGKVIDQMGSGRGAGEGQYGDSVALVLPHQIVAQPVDANGSERSRVSSREKEEIAAGRHVEQWVDRNELTDNPTVPGSQPTPVRSFNTESYDRVVENAFLTVAENPLSTFGLDVDTASYSNIRRFLNGGQLPPKDAVRIEEMVNYFPYSYAPPTDGKPFAARVEVAGCPWAPEHRLVRIAVKGKEISAEHRPASNLVFLIDVSGSMMEANKLALIKQSLPMMVEKLDERDRVSLVVYAGNAGTVLEPTRCTPQNKGKILAAIANLEAGGSTNGGQGIELAYQTAASNFIEGGTNRVILATDGDWNVGITNQGDLTRMIESKAKGGVFLSVLGFGMGNYKDSTVQKLADKGNGNYAYIDSAAEAKKVLVDQMAGTLVTIAKDVKVQVEFNPAKAAGYRLIGYEKRLLAKEDFNDDKKDAGEIGAGHTVTALYEVVPAGQVIAGSVDPLRYQASAPGGIVSSEELLTVKLRYKEPDGETSKLTEFPVKDEGVLLAKATGDFKFSAAVAGVGMVLRDSEFKGNATLAGMEELAIEAKGEDVGGYRNEFVELVKKARAIKGQ